MLKEALKGKKGITLIALIITIIVLLILAGVTIAAITSNESAPNKAVEARTKNDEGAARDTATLLVAEKTQEYYEEKYVSRTSNVANVGTYLSAALENPVTRGDYKIVAISNALKVFDKNAVIDNDEPIVSGTILDNGNISWGEISTYEPDPTTNDFYGAVYDTNSDGIGDTLVLSHNALTNDSYNGIITKNYDLVEYVETEDSSKEIEWGGLGNKEEAIESITTIDVINKIRPNNMKDMFWGLQNLTTVEGVKNIITKDVKNMGGLFGGTPMLTELDLSSWDVSNVTSFEDDQYETIFYTDSYQGLKKLNISGWKFNENVDDLGDLGLFFIDELNMSNCHFTGEESLSGPGGSLFSDLDVKKVNLSNVNFGMREDVFKEMFASCDKLIEVDLTGIDTTYIKSTEGMFSGCEKLEKVYVDESWNLSNVTNSNNMFASCTSLVGDKNTTCDGENNIDKTYARIDKAPTEPGYFCYQK